MSLLWRGGCSKTSMRKLICFAITLGDCVREVDQKSINASLISFVCTEDLRDSVVCGIEVF